MRRMSQAQRAALRKAHAERRGDTIAAGGHRGGFGLLAGSHLSESIIQRKEGDITPIKRIIKRKLPFELDEETKSKSKRHRPTPDPTPPLPPFPEEELVEIEREWHAVMEHNIDLALGVSSNNRDEEIAARWGVGTGRTVRNLAARLQERGSLARKKGSGAKGTVVDNTFYVECFGKKAIEWDYEFTHEDMANALKEETGVGSKSAVQRLMSKLEYKRRRRIIRPFLTPEHMGARLEWAKRWMKFRYNLSNTCVVWIDEKCFYAFKSRGTICYCPPGVDPTPDYALSKTQIPWVMFLGACAAPRMEHDFDGKIGLWHVGEEKTALRKSKFHERGDSYWANVNMDGDVFMRMIKELLIPAILNKCTWVDKILVQMDSAGGHRTNESLPELNRVGAACTPRIEFECQPYRSPDCNLWDLGIWNSTQSRVQKVKYDKNAKASMNQRIIDAVMTMWDEYPGEEKLGSIVLTLAAVHREIIAHLGGNSFAQPRKL
jgi:transposase